MADTENRVRKAAQELHDAIVAARGEGYRVHYPSLVENLPKIAISETRKVGEAARPAPGDEYEAMTKHALVELATARGIELASGATKADVISALKSPPRTTF